MYTDVQTNLFQFCHEQTISGPVHKLQQLHSKTMALNNVSAECTLFSAFGYPSHLQFINVILCIHVHVLLYSACIQKKVIKKRCL